MSRIGRIPKIPHFIDPPEPVENHCHCSSKVPLLCLANKQDKPDAISVQESGTGSYRPKMNQKEFQGSFSKEKESKRFSAK